MARDRVVGKAAHAQSANQAVNPIDAAIPVVGALRALERAMNDDVDDPALEGDDHPYNVNVGTIRAGDWASSVPAVARLDVRIGHPTAWTRDEAQERVRAAIEDATRDDPWLAEHPPRDPTDGLPRPGVLARRGPSARGRARRRPSRRARCTPRAPSGWGARPTPATT